MESQPPDSVDGVFAALADPTRRDVLALVAGQPATSASALARQLPITRQAITKHLDVLADAGLVIRGRHGREVTYRADPGTLLATSDWLRSIADSWTPALEQLKRRAESP